MSEDPDDIMSKILSQLSNGPHELSAQERAFQQYGILIRQLYMGFVQAGFDEKEAFDLVKNFMSSLLRGGLNDGGNRD